MAVLKLTFSDMQGHVLAIIHETGEAAYETLVKGWLNRAYLKVMSHGRAYFQEKAGTLPLVEDQQLYDLADGCEQVILESVRISTTGHEGRMFYTPYEKITNYDPDLSGTGKPSLWCGVGEQLFTYPKCNSTYGGDTVSYMYWRKVEKLVDDDDVTILPPEFDLILEHDATLTGMRGKAGEYVGEQKEEIRRERDRLLRKLYSRAYKHTGAQSGGSLDYWIRNFGR